MRSLGDLLKSHRIPGVRLSEIRAICAKVAADLTKYPVTSKQVRVKEGVVYFSVPSVVKSELLLREIDFKTLLTAAGITVTGIK
jgi:hypothetical protein